MNTSNALGDNRRGFLTKTAAVLCGGAACAGPIALGAAAFFHPLRLKGQAGQFVRLASLDILPADGSPRKFVVIAQRTDAWSRFPDEPVGMVFLRRLGKGQVEALQVVCPHAGCHVDFDQKNSQFYCPCHAARFEISGKRLDPAHSPSPRDLDSLQAEVRNGGEVWVKFENFRTGTPRKTAES